MKIEDFSPRIQRLIRFINRLEARLEKGARARRAQHGGGWQDLQYPGPPASDPMKLDWGMGKASLNPIVREHWNDELHG